MIACAYTGAPAPWKLIVAQACEMLHQLPSKMEEEPVDGLIQTLSVLGIYHEWYNADAHKDTQDARDLE